MLQVSKSVTVNRPREEVYRFWRDFENLPALHGAPRVGAAANGDAVALGREGAGGHDVEWDAEIVEDAPGELIAWRRVAGATSTTRHRALRRRAGDAAPKSEVELSVTSRPAAGPARWSRSCSARSRASRSRRPAPLQAGDGDRRGGTTRTAASRARTGDAGQRPPRRRRNRRREQVNESELLDGQDKSVEVRDVPDPKILNQRDAIVRITSTAICGSDLHLYNGFIPTMEKGDILGHEFMGEVVEVGAAVKNLKVGDRVVVPFRSPAATAWRARHDNCVALRELEPQRLDGGEDAGATRPPASSATRTCWRLRRRPGGVRARAVRRRRPAEGRGRPDRRAGAVPVRHLPDRLHGRGDVRHQAGRHDRGLGLRPGRAVRDRERVSAGRRARDRDRPLPVPAADGARRRPAPRRSTTRRSTCLRGAEGDDRRAAGRTRASTPSAWRRTGTGLVYAYDRVKQALMLETDRPIALREAIMACRNGGIVSVIGVYGGFIDKFPMGARHEPLADDQDAASATCSAT